MAVVTAKGAIAAYAATSSAAAPPAGLVPGGPPGGAPPPAGPNLNDHATASEHVVERVIASIAAIAVVILALWIIVKTVDDPTFVQGTAPAAPVEGLTIFAVFFVAAAAIERLIEPLSKMLPSATDSKATADTAVAEAGKALVTQAGGTPLQTAAAKVDNANYLEFWKSLLLWLVATVIAMTAAAFLRLYFLSAVGISNGPRTLEILATGLIVGSGTKPLHDLVTLISKVSCRSRL